MTIADFECPHCEAEVHHGDIPDHFSQMQGDRFTYECECGCTFDVLVEYSPECTVIEDSMQMPKVVP